MIDKIDSNQIQGFKPANKPAVVSKAAQNTNANVSAEVNYAPLIEKAKQLPPTDDNAVKEAKELIASGQLDTPENIRAAAENIVEFGI